ncbi:MAG: alpha/beta hydrolase [Planctomycetota bacterium]
MKPATRLRMTFYILLGIGLVLVVGALVLRSAGDGLFYYPDSRTRATPADYGIAAAEDVRFAAPDGPELHGWWLPAEAAESRGTVVYCHGNAANLTAHAAYIAWLPKHGYSVLLFDYRGYGRSAGKVTRAGTVADAVAAIDYALARDPDRTVVFGHSLGGAVGVVAAAQRPAVRGVLAESTFANYRAIAQSKARVFSSLVPFFVSQGHDPDAVVASLAPRPLLVIHGDRDDVVPHRFGQDLFDAAADPKELWIVPGAPHVSPWTLVPREFERRFDKFFDAALASPR